MLKIDGKVVHAYKTFFPHNCTDERVVKAIFEAYKYGTNKKLLKLQSSGEYSLRGITKLGMEIKMYINKSGKIVTAYPLVQGI